MGDNDSSTPNRVRQQEQDNDDKLLLQSSAMPTQKVIKKKKRVSSASMPGSEQVQEDTTKVNQSKSKAERIQSLAHIVRENEVCN